MVSATLDMAVLLIVGCEQLVVSEQVVGMLDVLAALSSSTGARRRSVRAASECGYYDGWSVPPSGAAWARPVR